MDVSMPVSRTAWVYARQRVVKYVHPSVVPPEDISGLLTGAGFALAVRLWTMAWVDSTTAAMAGSISAGVLKVHSGNGH